MEPHTNLSANLNFILAYKVKIDPGHNRPKGLFFLDLLSLKLVHDIFFIGCFELILAFRTKKILCIYLNSGSFSIFVVL